MKARDLFSILTKHRVNDLTAYDDGRPEVREVVTELADANVVSSRRLDPGFSWRDEHAILLDLDVPADLVASSTPGHSHLYVDVRAPWPEVVKFLEAAANIGLIERGYASVSIARGYTSLRLPWVKKGEQA